MPPGGPLWVLFLGILGSLSLCAAYAALDALRAWRSAPARRRRGFLLAVSAAALASALLARGVEPRAGRHNEHALGFLASSASATADLPVFFAEREASPRVLLAAYESAAGRSLEGVRLFQLLVWGLTGFFVFAALRRGGAGASGAAAGAALYLWNFHAIVLARSFAPDLACPLFLAAGVYALVRFATEKEPRRALRAFACLGAASYLAFTAKFEFGAVVLAGGALVLLSGQGRLVRTAPGAAAAGAAALAALYGHFLSVVARPDNKLLPAEALGALETARRVFVNLHFHLVTANLGEAFGAYPGRGLTAAAILAALAAAAWTRPRGAEPSRFFWAAFLAVWIALIGALHLPMSFYPLSHSRHHLFVFLPFVYLFGVLSGRASQARPRAAAAGLALFLCAYAGLNAARVRAYRGELRTHDRELAFLLDSRRDWPEGCLAVDPLPGLRSRVLRKYFPYWSPEPGAAVPSCLLLYRSPRGGPAFGPRRGEELAVDALRLPAWRERTFPHRWFTDWHVPADWSQYEALSPVEVTVGFYKAGPADWSALSARLEAAALARRREQASAEDPLTPAALRDVYHPLDAAYERSVEFCYKRALAPAFASWSRNARQPGRGLGLPDAAALCFDEGLRDAEGRGSAAEQVDLLAAKAVYLRGLGRDADARAALARARSAAAAARYRGRALLRADFAEGLAPVPSAGYAQ